MRKVIMCLAMSFDGFIEGPNGEIDWIVFDAEGGSDLTAFLKEIDTVIYGRVSYEMWGNVALTDESSEFEKGFYGDLYEMDRYVFSRTAKKLRGNATVVDSDATELVADLKSKPGKHIWLYGGASLITTFMNLDLVDEFRIAVMPVVLGKGKPLFENIEHSHRMRLVNVDKTNSGVILLTYEVLK
jgi:dihydrofolate reductase